MGLPRFEETLDPDAPLGKIYTFRIQLPDGDSISDATIDAVDSSSTIVDPAPQTTISEKLIGIISGNLWGVSFRAQGGILGRLYLRCRYETAFGNGDDATYWILVKQR